LLEALHRNRQFIGALEPDEILVDETSRICCAASDRVRAFETADGPHRVSSSSHSLEFAAPEVRRETAELDARSDLYSWAALFFFLLTGEQAGDISPGRMGAFTAAL